MFGSYPIYQNVCRFPQFYQNISNILQTFCVKASLFSDILHLSLRSHSHSLSLWCASCKRETYRWRTAPLATPKHFL